MSDTCAHGRGRTVRCRQCEREGLAYGRSPLTDAREALEGLAALEGETVEVVADGRRPALSFAFSPEARREIARTPWPGVVESRPSRLPIAPDGAVSTLTKRVVRERMAAIEAMLARSLDTARAHCRATGDALAGFPVLATDGQNPVEAVERVELRCGVCQTPVDGLLFSVRLQVGREAVAQA